MVNPSPSENGEDGRNVSSHPIVQSILNNRLIKGINQLFEKLDATAIGNAVVHWGKWGVIICGAFGLGAYLVQGIASNHKTARSEAWRVLNSALEQSGSGGRVQALEDLNNWSKLRDKFNIDSYFPVSSDVSSESEFLSYLSGYIGDYLYGKEIELKAVKLNKAFLRRINLKDADLDYANLQDSNLWNADLTGASLRKVNFQRAVLQHAKLGGANLQGANLNGANLFKANLSCPEENLKCGEHFKGTKLIGASLIGADLTGNDLSQCEISRTIYNESTRFSDGSIPDELSPYLIKIGVRENHSGKDFTNVNFSGADLRLVNLSGANLSGADLSQTKNLDLANLSRMIYTQQTKFPDDFRILRSVPAYLIRPGVNLSNQDLSGVNLSGLNLRGVNFTGTNLSNAHLEGTNLENAIISRDTTNFKGAYFDLYTQLPKGLDPDDLKMKFSGQSTPKFD
ncbi:MAG: pentapeptide repeat-containing protein [Pleurocapsa sp. MO_192.B19]|nr:pentapeptide repeat-containing protein [Pleurocapsa sp. MO_192.B19]